jgi:hypothetical protein
MVQALFANQRETNLASTVAIVEEVLAELGRRMTTAKIEVPGTLHAWQIEKGSATARVTIFDRKDFPHIRACAIVMTLNAKVDRPALYSHLLELNAGLCGAAFATDGDKVLLVSERSTLDLDRSEIADLILRITTTADEHDNVLVARFGGRLGA